MITTLVLSTLLFMGVLLAIAVILIQKFSFLKKGDETVEPEMDSLEKKVKKRIRILSLQDKGLDLWAKVQTKLTKAKDGLTNARKGIWTGLMQTRDGFAKAGKGIWATLAKAGSWPVRLFKKNTKTNPAKAEGNGKFITFSISTLVGVIASMVTWSLLSSFLTKVDNLTIVNQGLNKLTGVDWLTVKTLAAIAVFALIHAYFRNFVYMANSDKQKIGTGALGFWIAFIAILGIAYNVAYIGASSIESNGLKILALVVSSLVILSVFILFLAKGWVKHENDRGEIATGIPEKHVAIIECFGKRVGSKGPGFCWIFPYVNTGILVPLTQQDVHCVTGENVEHSSLSINGQADEHSVFTIAGDIEIKGGMSIGLDWSFYFEIQPEQAHKSLYNVPNYYDYLTKRISSALRSFLFLYTFEEINEMKGRSVLPFILQGSHPDGTPFKLSEMVTMPSDKELEVMLKKCPLYRDILNDVGTRITTLSVNDVSFSADVMESRRQIYKAEQKLKVEKVGIKIAKAKADQKIKESEGEKIAIMNKMDGTAEGFKFKINNVMTSSRVHGSQALAFINTESQNAAIEHGANATLIEGGSGRFADNVLAGAGVGTGFHAQSKKQTKEMFKTVCDQCGVNCEVPFKPSGDKPIFCRNCFSDKSNRRDDSKKRNPQPPNKGDQGNKNKP